MKKIFSISILLIALLFSGFVFVQAKQDQQTSANDSDYAIPEQDGTYNVPGHPELKVRVFVHKTKPSFSPQPELKCGLDDPESKAVVDWAGWKLPAIFTYNLNPNNAPALVGSASWPLIAENSFNVWEKAISNKVNVKRGADTTIARRGFDGKNIIAWGSTSASALGVTYIWYYPSTGVVVELDTIMNKKYLWTWSGSSTCAYTNSYDAQSILTHELGHWFGLDDEYTSEYVNNTMYGYGFMKDAKGDTLTSGDIDGAKAIYYQ